MPINYILAPLANDAKYGAADGHPVYLGVGPNSAKRLEESARWAERSIPLDAMWYWYFGAGTDAAHRHGPTLAALAAQVILKFDLYVKKRIVYNNLEREFYGTFEEIKWVMREVAKNHRPRTVKVVFFTSRRHMWRVRLIWLLYYRSTWGRAIFVVTSDHATPSWKHEVGGMGMAVRHRMAPKWFPTRDQKPYPSRGGKGGKIEC